MDNEDAEEPLLTVSVDLPTEPDQAHDAPQPESIDNAKTLQRALYRNPREAIKWLEKEGVKKLGTFRVQAGHQAGRASRPRGVSIAAVEIQAMDALAI